MPQFIHVVKCYKCGIFQSDIVKKIKKWQCKLCNEQQSLQKVYFEGLGKECRLFVQEINKQRSCNENVNNLYLPDSHEPDNSHLISIERPSSEIDEPQPNITNSKWCAFIATTENESKSNIEEAVRDKDNSDKVVTSLKSDNQKRFCDDYDNSNAKKCKSFKENTDLEVDKETFQFFNGAENDQDVPLDL